MIHAAEGGFDLRFGGRVLLRHRPDAPCLFVGHGTAAIAMYRGNFDITERLDERVPLRHATVQGASVVLRAEAHGAPLLTLDVSGTGTDAQLRFTSGRSDLNRLWLRVVAEVGEHAWGGGEQMSFLDLRGRRFPMWTSEPGVGRDKTTAITWQADVSGHAGGDYWTTNYPQPTYLSSRRYALHIDTTAYSALDFRADTFHELEVWDVPARVELWARDGLPALVGALADRFGRPRALPDWIYAGAVIGLKDGERSFERLEAMLAAGVHVSGLWCEDWVGLRETSFGSRLFWDWRLNEQRYPGLPARIAALRARGIRFLGYVNPYLCDDGGLFAEAAEAGYLARTAEGAVARVDFGEFDCGVVDFTAPGAAGWFAERIIGREMLDAGLSGWMADFGEYLPTDLVLAHGDPALLHNAWPTIWAEVNADAIASRGSDALFFMRAGFTGVGAHCPLLWGGDQSVDWTRHDGLPSAICGALSAGLVGNAFHHSDVGGYTSLFGNVRTAELVMRWAEMAIFTPFLRTHEGNRPRENIQVDDPAVLPHFARCTRMWTHLAPYHRDVAAEAVATGLPAQRPLFLMFEDDPRCGALQDSFLYGPDLLVAPVLLPDATDRTAYLPAGADWTHLWSGQRFAGGAAASVPAPLGQPPVFVRASSPHRALFDGLRPLLQDTP